MLIMIIIIYFIIIIPGHIIQALLYGGLNPLKFCQDEVVAEFERLGLCDVAAIVTANANAAIGSLSVTGQSNKALIILHH